MSITNIKIGQTINTKEADITITDIYIDGFHLKSPTTWIKYAYATADKQGTEQNTLANFKRMIADLN